MREAIPTTDSAPAVVGLCKAMREAGPTTIALLFFQDHFNHHQMAVAIFKAHSLSAWSIKTANALTMVA